MDSFAQVWKNGKISAGLPYKLMNDGTVIEQGTIDQGGNIKFEHELDATAKYGLELSNGLAFAIDASAYSEKHEMSSGAGYHGYVSPGGSLAGTSLPLEQHCLKADPSSEDS